MVLSDARRRAARLGFKPLTVTVLVALLTATLLDWYWPWGLLFLYWVVVGLRQREAFLIERIAKERNPILYWCINGLWAGSASGRCTRIWPGGWPRRGSGEGAAFARSMDTEHAMKNAADGRGRIGHTMPDRPAQRLPRDAYVSRAWFERERRDLFGHCWICAGAARDLAMSGDYVTVTAGDYPLMVLRDESGTLRAFHNLCRHRGTELVEGSGRLERARIACPYHRWTYDLDGSLRAVPMRARCFADLDTDAYSLLPAAIGELGGLIFVNPNPRADFAAWQADLESVLWPHRFERMSAGLELTYEIHCNWKVFLENAIDGYHLAYLHSETLGGPRADRNVWDVHGRHLVWYSTETGRKTCLPEGVATGRKR